MAWYKFVGIFTLVVLSIIGYVSGEINPAGGVKLQQLVESTRNVQCDAGQRFGCADCFTAQVCEWDGAPIESSKYRCATLGDHSKPYCLENTGVCSADPAGSCVKPSELCPAIGFYPQPTNCSEFLFCDEKKNAFLLTCDRNQAYSHQERDCVAVQKPQDCFRINCAAAASRDKWFSYSPAPELYVFCSSTVGPMTFQCEGENIAFDVGSRQCVFRCPAVGRYPIPGEPAGSQRYYQCSLVAGNVLQHSIQKCPGMFIFDAELRICVPPGIIPTTERNEN